MLDTDDGFDRLQPKEALAYLVDKHLQEIEIEPRERRKYQYVELLLDLLRDAGKTRDKPWTENCLQDAVRQAERLIDSFIWACQRNDERGKQPLGEPERFRVIWEHRDLGQAFKYGFTSKEACPMDRESMAALADEYLQQDLRSPKLEVLLVDALVAREVYAYGEELKQTPSRFMRNFSFGRLVLR